MAARRPELRSRQPFKAALTKDLPTLAAAGKKELLEIIAATHAGMSIDQFHKIVLDWTATARHPRFNRPYTDLAINPCWS